jgi:uncharacterized protein YecT (DUF1311 family)
MQSSRSLCLFLLVAAFLPLHPQFARADGGYANFQPTRQHMQAMLSRDFEACVANSRGITASINECTWAEFVRIDRRLNTSYQSKISRLSRANVQRLRSDQRGWLATRDETCLADLKDEREGGGTIYSILLSSCQLQELQRRVLWIERRP